MIQININDIANKVRGAVLTGLSTATNAAITATDTVLQAFGKLQAQINSKISSSEKGQANGVATLDGGGKVPSSQLPSSVMQYQGQWNASTNTPELANGTGDAGDVYEVSVAGTHDFGAGAITFKQGDWAVYNGTIWERSINSNEVVSVNGYTGAVTLAKSDIGLGNVENTALSTWTGSANITTIGTVSTGTWSANTIGVAYGGTGTQDGSITGTGTLTFTAGGSNRNIILAPSGTGGVVVGSSTPTNSTAYPLEMRVSSNNTRHIISTNDSTGGNSNCGFRARAGSQECTFAVANQNYSTVSTAIKASGGFIWAAGNGGFSLIAAANNSNAAIRFYTGGLTDSEERWRIRNSNGNLSNTQSDGTAYIDLKASTTSSAHIRLQAGVAPTSPNNGDIWFDGTDLKIRIGGVTKTFTVS